MRIPDSFIQQLLARLDVVEVVGRTLRLKRAGKDYVACCPFHKEKSPSFSVSPAKQFYHCFGCGAHGSAIGFVMQHEALGFVETVEKLAQSVGMRVPREAENPVQGIARAQNRALAERNAQAMDFYRAQLKEAPHAIDYLKRRALNGRTAARFRLGYAPAGTHPLAACFSDYATDPALADLRLVIDRDDGRRRDFFRDRIIFPILDGKEQVVGFGARAIRPDDQPKYLNTPETPLFHKGIELYGLPQARQAIRQHNRVLVVEGYMDVVMLAQYGVEYAVATLGTACTEIQVGKLLRLADTVIFCFDGDTAGQRAAWRALENSLPQTEDIKALRFLLLPDGLDPDDYVQRHGSAGFEQLAQRESLELADFFCQGLAAGLDLHGAQGRAQFLETARPLLQQIRAPGLALLIRKQVVAQAGITADEADYLLPAVRPAVQAGSAPRGIGSRPGTKPSHGAAADTSRTTGYGGGVRAPRAFPRTSPPPQGVEIEQTLLRFVLLFPELALRLSEAQLAQIASQPSLTMQALSRVVDYIREQSPLPLAGHLLEAFRGEAVFYAYLFDQLQQAETHYATFPSQADAATTAIPQRVRMAHGQGTESLTASTGIDVTANIGSSAEELGTTLRTDWEEALHKLMYRLEGPRRKVRLAELEAKVAARGLSRLNEAERAEYRQLALARPSQGH